MYLLYSILFVKFKKSPTTHKAICKHPLITDTQTHRRTHTYLWERFMTHTYVCSLCASCNSTKACSTYHSIYIVVYNLASARTHTQPQRTSLITFLVPAKPVLNRARYTNGVPNPDHLSLDPEIVIHTETEILGSGLKVQ